MPRTLPYQHLHLMLSARTRVRRPPTKAISTGGNSRCFDALRAARGADQQFQQDCTSPSPASCLVKFLAKSGQFVQGFLLFSFAFLAVFHQFGQRHQTVPPGLFEGDLSAA